LPDKHDASFILRVKTAGFASMDVINEKLLLPTIGTALLTYPVTVAAVERSVGTLAIQPALIDLIRYINRTSIDVQHVSY